MRQALYQLLCLAISLLPFKAFGQTFNHVYPNGGDRLGIFAEQINGGYQLVANASPVEHDVKFVYLQVGNFGTQLSSDTFEYNNSGSYTARFNLISNGFIARSSSDGTGNDILLAKHASDGTLIWIHEYDLTYYDYLSPGVVVEGSNGELFVYGYMFNWSTHSGQFYLLKTTADGQKIWLKTFSVYANSETSFPNVDGGTTTADGGFVLVANSQNLVKFFLRFDVDGNHEVVTTVNSFDNNPTLVIEATPGKAVFAYSETIGIFGNINTKAKLAQYSLSTGGLDWEMQLQPFDTPISQQQLCISALAKTNDGGFLVAGHGMATSTQERLFIVKVNGMGQVVWKKHDYGFTAEVAFVQETASGGILVSGRREGLAWLMHTDAQGNVDCTNSYTNASAEICEGESYEFGGQTLTEAGNYTHLYQTQGPCDSIATLTLSVHPVDTKHKYETLCIGEVSYLTDNQYLQAGDFVETATYLNIHGCDSTIINYIHVDSFIFIEGWAHVPYGEVFLGQVITQSGWYGSSDTSEFGCITYASFEVYCIYGASSDKLSEQISLASSPNPFCDEAIISFKLPASATVSATIFDAQGRRATTVLEDEKLPSGEHRLTVRTEEWPSGVYLLRFMVEGQIGTERMVKGCG